MQLTDINPLTLPSLPLAQRRSLPSCPAIYFVLEGCSLCQCKANNLLQRWAMHHRYSQLKSMENVRLEWFGCSHASLLPEIEQALIEWFNPPMNGLAVATDKARVSTYIDYELKEQAEKAAQLERRSLSNYLEQLIKRDVESKKSPKRKSTLQQRLDDPYSPPPSTEELRRLIGDDNPTNPYTPPANATPGGRPMEEFLPPRIGEARRSKKEDS